MTESINSKRDVVAKTNGNIPKFVLCAIWMKKSILMQEKNHIRELKIIKKCKNNKFYTKF